MCTNTWIENKPHILTTKSVSETNYTLLIKFVTLKIQIQQLYSTYSIKFFHPREPSYFMGLIKIKNDKQARKVG